MANFYPFISVIICSKNRHNLLLKSVNSILRVDYPSSKMEIVVVEEGETPNPINGVKYVYLPLKNLGLGYCHNKGIENASGDIIAFTDDDVEVDVNWLKELVSVFIDLEIYGTSGLVRTQRGSYFGETEEILGLPGGGIRILSKSRGKIISTKCLSTCNLAYRKEVFTEFSFYEESFGKLGGDDWYFGKQVSDKYKCVFNPNAIVHHKPRANIYRLIHTYYRRQITDYLYRRDIIKQSKNNAVLGKMHRSMILRTFAAISIVALFKLYGLLFLIAFYYLVSLASIIYLFSFINSKISFFLFPITKFTTELGILKGELFILFSSEKRFYEILKNY